MKLQVWMGMVAAFGLMVGAAGAAQAAYEPHDPLGSTVVEEAEAGAVVEAHEPLDPL